MIPFRHQKIPSADDGGGDEMKNNPGITLAEQQDLSKKRYERMGNFSSWEEQAWWEEHIIFG